MKYELEGYVTDIEADIYILGKPTECAVRTSCGESLITIGSVPIAEAPRIGDPVKVTVEVGADA